MLHSSELSLSLQIDQYSIDGKEYTPLGGIKRSFGGQYSAQKIGDDTEYVVVGRVDSVGEESLKKMNGRIIQVSDMNGISGNMVFEKLKLTAFRVGEWAHFEVRLKQFNLV